MKHQARLCNMPARQVAACQHLQLMALLTASQNKARIVSKSNAPPSLVMRPLLVIYKPAFHISALPQQTSSAGGNRSGDDHTGCLQWCLLPLLRTRSRYGAQTLSPHDATSPQGLISSRPCRATRFSLSVAAGAGLRHLATWWRTSGGLPHRISGIGPVDRAPAGWVPCHRLHQNSLQRPHLAAGYHALVVHQEFDHRPAGLRLHTTAVSDTACAGITHAVRNCICRCEQPQHGSSLPSEAEVADSMFNTCSPTEVGHAAMCISAASSARQMPGMTALKASHSCTCMGSSCNELHACIHPSLPRLGSCALETRQHKHMTQRVGRQVSRRPPRSRS